MSKENPLIGDLPRETVQNAVNILELLQYLDFSAGIDKKAEFGLFLVHQMLAEALEDVDERLKKIDVQSSKAE